MMEWYHYLCVLVPCIIYEIVMTRKAGGGDGSPLLLRGRKAVFLHTARVLIFCTYLNLVLRITGIGTLWDIGKYDSLFRADEINLSPFSDVRAGDGFDVLNVMLFVPFGFLLPRIWEGMRNALRVAGCGFLLSFAIEICQLFNFRATDVNDVIYNTFGALVGYLFWRFVTRKSRGALRPGRASAGVRSEPVLLVLLSVFGVFLLYNPRAGIPAEEAQSNLLKITERNSTLPRPDEASLDFEKNWILENASLFPAGKAEKAVGNPELIHFMFMLGNGDTSCDSKRTLSEDELSDGIPYLFQWDRRWGFEPYGENNIGFSGCGPTCLAMVLSFLTQNPNLTPQTLADYAMNHDYYESGSGTRWAFMTETAEAYGVAAQSIPLSEIPTRLTAGSPVIVSVGKGHFTETGHFIVLTDMEDGKIRVHDPNSIANSERLWDFEEFKGEIKSAWGYGSGSVGTGELWEAE